MWCLLDAIGILTKAICFGINKIILIFYATNTLVGFEIHQQMNMWKNLFAVMHKIRSVMLLAQFLLKATWFLITSFQLLDYYYFFAVLLKFERTDILVK